METTELKNTVIRYLENADERLLKMIKALIESYGEEGPVNTALNDEQYLEIDRRREEYFKDPEATYTWEEVKENLRNPSKK